MSFEQNAQQEQLIRKTVKLSPLLLQSWPAFLISFCP